MKTSTRLFPLLILSVQAATAAAAESAAGTDVQDQVDKSEWKCKYCAFEEGLNGYVDVGAGYVSTDSYKFGEYTGLYQKGGYFIGDAGVRFRGEDALYWNLDASNLGLDTRSLGLEGGKQGRYKISLTYDELPHYISDSGFTPYLGVGSTTLTLPGSWVPAGSTAGMTDLANSERPVNFETKRKRLGVGLALDTQGHWEYAVKVRHETREGTQRTAGAFYFRSAQLAMPVDTETNQIDASASYNGSKLQARFAYYGSLFSDNNTALNWQNPYAVVPGGPDAGQLSLPPENQFHQVLFSGGYQFTDRTRATADVAWGRMTQNDPYLAATVNSNLAPVTLPAASLDGRVDTLNASLKVNSRVSENLRLNASYVYNDHADKTPQEAYTWVTTDTFVNPTPRTNLPYSFTQNTVKLSGDYGFTTKTRGSVGVDVDSLERTYQEVSKNRENTVWGRIGTRALGNTDLSLKGSYADRTVSNYEVLPWLSPAENPLMRKYNMADRTRGMVGARADFYASKIFNFGLGIDYAGDDYSKSQIGLTSSTDTSFTADASAILAKDTSVHAYYTREKIYSKQAGSFTASTPDWTGETNDVFDTGGIGIKHALLQGKLAVGADYFISHGRGEQIIEDGSGGPLFPDIASRLAALKLHATYQLKDSWSLNGTYWYEHYMSDDWHLDGVTPDTIGNVLTFGEQPPAYYANVVMVSVRYKF